jgi:hypothetical protein
LQDKKTTNFIIKAEEIHIYTHDIMERRKVTSVSLLIDQLIGRLRFHRAERGSVTSLIDQLIVRSSLWGREKSEAL